MHPHISLLNLFPCPFSAPETTEKEIHDMFQNAPCLMFIGRCLTKGFPCIWATQTMEDEHTVVDGSAQLALNPGQGYLHDRWVLADAGVTSP